MGKYVLNIVGHSADLKTSPTKSKDTGIFFPQELVEFLGNNEDYSFKIHREDFARALVSILSSLPLYSNKGGRIINHVSIFDEASRMINSISRYFGDKEISEYSGFSILESTYFL